MTGIVSVSRTLTVLAIAFFLIFFNGTGMAQTCTDWENCVTILHTNDMHSRMLASPNRDYTPGSTGDDSTVGGIARMATVINNVRDARDPEGIPVLLLDGGDFTMGTLFHLLGGEAEMGIMNHLGYDAVTLGNHEFDWLPTGAANIVGYRGAIPVLATNLSVINPLDPWGAAIQARIDSGDIVDTAVQTLSNGLKVGYFGLMGVEAFSVINKPYGSVTYPIEFTDMVSAATAAVSYLKNTEGVDIVICLSHSGLNDSSYGTGEDVDLAAAVPDIDVIISGHTHSYIPAPIVVGDTIVNQAGDDGKRLGVLNLERVSGTWELLSWWDYPAYVVIDDSIPGDSGTQTLVEGYIADLNTNWLGPRGYSFSQAVAETAFDVEEFYPQEHGLGNLVADAIRWSVDQVRADPSDPVDVAVESNGVIRDELLQGTTGVIQTSDAFGVVPLGIDPVSEQAGYPLLSFCMSGQELYNAAWVNALAPFLNNSDYWLSWSGAGFQYIDFLPPLSMWQCLDPEDPACASRLPVPNSPGVLYRVAVNSYVASNIENIADLSYGLIVITPKDCDTGLPLASLADALVYESPGDPLMQWEGFLDFLAQFPDTDTDGVPNIPTRYSGPEKRFFKACVVATAAYGSPFEKKVGLLRDFRDEILMKSPMGRKFVDLYYTHGAPVAEAVAGSERLKALVRILLLPLVGVSKFLLWVF